MMDGPAATQAKYIFMDPLFLWKGLPGITNTPV